MLFRRASAADEPELIGTRSRTASGVVAMSSPLRWRAGERDHEELHDAARPAAAPSGARPRCSRSVLPSYSVRNTPRSCSSGTTVSANSSSPPGVMCGTRMKPSLASAWTSVSICPAIVAGEPGTARGPVGREGGGGDEAGGGVGLAQRLDLPGDRGRRAGERLAARDLDNQLAD